MEMSTVVQVQKPAQVRSFTPPKGAFNKPPRTHRGGGVPWYLRPQDTVWGPYTKLPRDGAPNPRRMSCAEIRQWVDTRLPLLDAPETLVPDMNCSVRPWETEDPNHDRCRLGIIIPVEYGAAIANLGVATIYDIVNHRNPDLAICERAYYPEPKLKKALLAKKVPMFSKETRHALRDFDMVCFSSFYPLQMLAVPDLLELGGINPYVDERGDDEPLVGFAGVQAFNAAPIYNMLDFIAIGEGEQQVIEMTRIWTEERNGPSAVWSSGKCTLNAEQISQLTMKDRVLLRWATETDGIYVPAWYEEEYFDADDIHHPGELKAHHLRAQYRFPVATMKAPNGKRIPEKIKKAIVDVNEVKPLTAMFVSNSAGEAMAAGSLMISQSCSNKCYFCQGSYVSQPYRERDLPMLLEAFDQIVLDTGAIGVCPYSFNLSDHSKINDIVFHLLSNGRKVSMSSQRIDYFSPDFARAAYLSGNRSITLAIEGGSQRMRDIISKNLTEGMILEAFRTAFEIGFNRIKIYMIANLPGEEESDREAVVDLMRAIHTVQREVQGDNFKTTVRVSYTPFVGKNFTPFQFAPGLRCDPITGLPVIEKTLGNIIARAHDLGYKFRVGTQSDLSILNWVLTHGDRRLAPVVMAIYRSPNLNYAGGMAIGKDPLVEIQGFLRSVGLDFEFFFREKQTDETFPWDHLSIRVSKRFLVDMWERSQAEQNVSICFDDCTKCGACTTESKDHFDARKEGTLEPGRASVASAIHEFKVPPVVQKLRIRYKLADEFRFIDTSKVKMRLRRAALRVGLPIRNEFAGAGDKILFQAWIAGVDYAEVGLHQRVIDIDEAELCQKLTAECEGSLEVLGVQILTLEGGNFRSAFEHVIYQLVIPSARMSYEIVEREFARIMAARNFNVKMKQKGLQRDAWVTVNWEARPHIHTLQAARVDGGTLCTMVLDGALGPYELLPAVFRTSKRNILTMVARRVDMLEKKLVGEDDMFASYCAVCNETVENNLFGQPISEDRCARHIAVEHAA